MKAQIRMKSLDLFKYKLWPIVGTIIFKLTHKRT